jgi:hypothetical protein
MDYRIKSTKQAQNRNLLLKLKNLSDMQNVQKNTLKELKSEAKKFNVTKLLSNGLSNAKTAKNDIKSFILYLSPSTQNDKGLNLCPHASAGCIVACLNTAGLAGVYPKIIQSRINKTNFYANKKAQFLNMLAHEIKNEIRKADGQKLVFRLNGTSDLDFVFLLKKYTGLDLLSLENVYFYDYTKVLARAKRYLNSDNYTVTFSRSESNEIEFLEAVKLGINTAVVFSHSLPKMYAGATVIDGDKSDIEMIYNKGIILGLKAKGKAKKDLSGFVVPTLKNI